jgi:hypothetical protein
MEGNYITLAHRPPLSATGQGLSLSNFHVIKCFFFLLFMSPTSHPLPAKHHMPSPLQSSVHTFVHSLSPSGSLSPGGLLLCSLSLRQLHLQVCRGGACPLRSPAGDPSRSGACTLQTQALPSAGIWADRQGPRVGGS